MSYHGCDPLSPPLSSGPELYIEIVTEDGTTYIGDIPVE